MASTSGSLTALVINSGDLVDLVSTSTQATIYPTDDSILSALHARFRADLPYTRIGTSNLVVVNPYKTLANVNDVSAREYEERCYKDTSLPLVDSPKPLQPHVYELAAKIYLLMRRRNQSQSIITRGITGSGKSASSRLLVSQLLRLSSHSRREAKVAEQINALIPLLDAFGNAKTPMNPNASRHSRYLELHFNERGRIVSGKVLAFGLDKSRLNRLSHEERSYHVFYQLLAGATPEERDLYNLEDPSDYALLASSGCYRLPAGPGSDDSIAMEDLRGCMASLGFKPKHMTAIFSLLVAILLIGNIQFGEADASDVSAYVSNTEVLDHAARLLGISPEDLSQTLTNKTSYVRKDLYTSLLNVEQSAAQRDHLVRDLYAILFAFVVETANHKIAPSSKDPPPPTQVVLFDQPGYQTRGPSGTGSMAFTGNMPLVSALGQSNFDEFCINFADEVVQSYVLRNVFEDAVGYNSHMTGDGVSLPVIQTMDNSACVELLRGAQLNEKASRKPNGMLGVMAKASSALKAGKGGDKRDEDMLQDMVAKVGVHASFVASPNVGGAANRNLFGINHYAGNCTYDVAGFVERNTDMLDSAFVSLLRNSNDGFVAKLLSGPSLAAEKHSKDESIVVQAQVSSRPLRQPTPASGAVTADEPSQLDPAKAYPVTTQLNHTLSVILASLDHTHLWTLSCIRPNDSGSANSFDKRRVKAQIRALLLPDLIARRSTEYIADYELAQFCERYVPTMQGSETERIRQCAGANGWEEGMDYKVGHRSVWLSYFAWKMVEDGVRAAEKGRRQAMGGDDDGDSVGADDATEYTHTQGGTHYDESNENLLLTRTGTNGTQYRDVNGNTPYGAGGLRTPGAGAAPQYSEADDVGGWGSEWDKKGGGSPGDVPTLNKEGDMTINPAPNTVEEIPTSRSRRWWLYIVWGMTGIIPSFLLTKVGRMKRPDMRLAWREKLTICMLILLLNCTVIFYIVEFGRLLCPNMNKAWDTNEVAQHQGTNDYWVSIQGSVYDVSNFVKGDHSDITGEASDGADSLEALAGSDMTGYFPPPLSLACPYLVTDPTLVLTTNFTPVIPQAMHNSGGTQQKTGTALDQQNWYTAIFQPKIKQYYKGPLVFTKQAVLSQGADPTTPRLWGLYEDDILDLTDYVATLSTQQDATGIYGFLDPDIVSVFKSQAGQDITKSLNAVLATKDQATVDKNMACIKNAFFQGNNDFRTSARCKVQNIILLVFSILLMASMAVKFLAALQLGSKRVPEMQDKFVLCQVPCYTEGEDSLRRTIDSLAALNYDDKRKLIFIICDGNIIGSGNDRTTPRIVLDILGVDPKLDPEPLLFKSVGEGSKQINYGKVYSGLYEFEGHVVPYMVIVKVGKPTERSKPGNRGKRDSQVLVMHYLNRVHFDAPMSPLELEIYHQMRNVIGIDPAFYEYIFTIDADTSVTPDALNRLVAASADDSSIIGVCGETKLANEQGSWWTMIQVYEYYISHHLSKAFESLFGSVTCLPGCFTLYRIRTADKGRPIIISNRVIDDYSEGNVDTLHKKNLFSLGEDRYLTTLLMKHFPTFRTKFIPDAKAQTVAPEAFRVLFSQRRRWINSTVHNLCELVALPELCGMCCFSMRFFVFIDLLGTLILPATVVYLFYLIIIVSLHEAPIPLISIAMIAATYGLQALIFLIHREFMLIGWMIVYLLSYPVYSFFLPIYSFWCMDEFGWGNTRLVIGEGGSKKVLVNEDEKYDDSMIPLKKFSEYEAEAWETGTHHSDDTGYDTKPRSHLTPRSRAESPHSYHQASQSGDYYRDTNPMHKTSNSNLHAGSRAPSHNSHQNTMPQVPQYGGLPQLPFIPFAGGAGSVAGSDYGMHMPLGTPQMMGYQNTGSGYGMMTADPRNTMMTNMNMFGGGSGSQSGGMGGAPPSLGTQPRPMSTFSMATTANMFAGPSMNPNPTDDDLVNALRNYLSTQDLMTVTKKTAREAMASRFPKADLAPRKEFLNQSIDTILSQS